MSTNVIMPQMGESVAEGTITQWFKKVGDRVERDEPLFEISTDKVDAEIPSPAAGYLAEIKVNETETVPVETVVALITEQPGETPKASKPAAAPATAPKPESAPVEASPTGQIPRMEELRRTRSSPLVRKMAQEHGVDITQLQGSGVSGRVTKKDMLTYLERREGAPAARPAASDRYRYQPAPTDRVEPFSPMRAMIADHMVISRETSVHVTTVFEVDMTRVARLRQAHKQSYAQAGVKLTFMPFIMKAVIDGLRDFPVLNSSVVDKALCYKKDIHLGMAVALDWGLLVPVVRHADEKSLKGLARTVADLAERARSKKLSPDEVQGGTFTITNPGVFGSLFGTPIINQPQVAILGVGGINKRPIVTEDDAIAIRHMMYLALSFDHRVVDGATADRFMARVKQVLQEFPEGNL